MAWLSFVPQCLKVQYSLELPVCEWLSIPDGEPLANSPCAEVGVVWIDLEPPVCE